MRIISVIVFVAMLTNYAPARLWIASLLIISILSGCAGNVMLSDDSVRIRNTVDTVNQLRVLYEEHDQGMLTLFSDRYLSESGIREAILHDMNRFRSISLSIFIDRMDINGDMVNVSIHWNGAWGNGDKTLREGGSAVIIIRSAHGLEIDDIKGSSPFGKSVR